MRLTAMAEQLWKSQRGLLILLGVLLALNVLLGVALEQLIAPRVAALERRFLQRQTEVRQMLHHQSRAATTPEQLYALGRQDIVKFYKAVPEYREFTALIEELLILSNRARLNIGQITYTSENLKTSPLLKFSLNFNVAGDYEQIKKFIHSLEQSVRLITIRQISLQGENDDDVNLRLSLETFFRPEGQDS